MNQLHTDTSRKRGRFITLEGGEGVGKSTNLLFIEQMLRARGVDLVCTREPGGTVFGETMRTVLLSDVSIDICAEAELLTVFAARAEHLHSVIIPALNAGKWVLCDRFTDASFAYQGGGRGITPERIEDIEQWVQGDVRPDMVLLLDAPVGVSKERASQRGALDRFERESSEFFEAVRQSYLQRAQAHPSRYAIIDARCSLANVQKHITHHLESLLSEAQIT